MEENAMESEDCQCGELWDREVVDLGVEDRTFVEVKRHPKPLSWISLCVCSDCGQQWLTGTDDFHNDVNCLLRLDADTAERIMKEDVWPPDFDRFETLLELARDARHKVRYGTDYSIHHPLCDMIRRLAKERQGIRVSRLASL